MNFAEERFVRSTTIENGAHRRPGHAAAHAPARKAHAIHAASQENCAITQDFDGQCLSNATAPLARAAGIRTDIVFHDTQAALCLHQLDRLVSYVVEVVVPNIGAIAAVQATRATTQRLDDLDNARESVSGNFRERNRYHRSAR